MNHHGQVIPGLQGAIPDDHDVGQGNLWGGGGRAVEIDTQGGYTRPAGYVQLVERQQTSHLPDPYDPTPIAQGLGTYFTRMNVGVVDFAIVDAYAFDGLPDGPAFDAAFAGCWWSHVPLPRLRPWLDALYARLQPGARVLFLDNSYVQTSSLPITHGDADGNTYQTRTLDDDSVHAVLKNFPTPDQVQTAAGPRARDFAWTAWTHYWAAEWTLA